MPFDVSVLHPPDLTIGLPLQFIPPLPMAGYQAAIQAGLVGLGGIAAVRHYMGRGKRAQASRTRRAKFRRPRYRIGKRWIKGKSRTGGYYGRFNQGGSNRPELKFHDVNVTTGGASTTLTVFNASLLLIAQNTTETGRIGRKIQLKSITTNFHCFVPDPATNPTHDALQIYLILDRQCNGANANLADFVDDTTNFLGMRNLANTQRFVTLWKGQYTFIPTAGAGNGTADTWGHSGHDFTIHRKMNIPVEYDGTTGTITEIQSNNLFWAVRSRHGFVDLALFTRIRFTG